MKLLVALCILRFGGCLKLTKPESDDGTPNLRAGSTTLNLTQHVLPHVPKRAFLLSLSSFGGTNLRKLSEPNETECRILHSTFAVLMQGILFLICFGVFVLKWRLETDRRPFLIFAKDSSKQVIGAGWMHALNMTFAIVFQALIPNKLTDECGWYWVNIMTDTTLGVAVSFFILKFLERQMDFKSGNYDETTGARQTYLHQLLAWICVVSLMKMSMILLMITFATSFASLANLVTLSISEDPDTRLVFVMIFTPAIMNCFQFISQDLFLRFYKDNSKGAAMPAE